MAHFASEAELHTFLDRLDPDYSPVVQVNLSHAYVS